MELIMSIQKYQSRDTRCLIAEVSLTVYYFYFHRIQRSLECIAHQLIRSLPDHNVYSFRCLQNGSTPQCALNYWACPIHAPQPCPHRYDLYLNQHFSFLFKISLNYSQPPVKKKKTFWGNTQISQEVQFFRYKRKQNENSWK